MLYFVSVLFSVVVCVLTQSNDGCKCVSFHLCREDEGTVITDGENLIQERLGVICPTCNCTGFNICCSLSNQTIEVRKPTVLKPCGYRNPEGVGYKFGKEEGQTLLGEFPWMIGIFENATYRCGGSLIHPSVVLTAAHCVKRNDTTYSARAGELDSGSTAEILKHQDRTVESIKMHENFNPKNYQNDVALVFLNEPFDLGLHINLACLVPSNVVATNVRCYSTGWGKEKFGSEEINQSILKRVDLPMVDSPTCQENLRKTRLGEYFQLHETFVCAGGEKGKDTCTGDGGGPLVCPIEGADERYHQVGIVAWGIGCQDENVPGVYTNVAQLRDWIDKQMKEKKFDIQYESQSTD